MNKGEPAMKTSTQGGVRKGANGVTETKTDINVEAWAFNLQEKKWRTGPLKGQRVTSIRDAQRQIDEYKQKEVNNG